METMFRLVGCVSLLFLLLCVNLAESEVTRDDLGKCCEGPDPGYTKKCSKLYLENIYRVALNCIGIAECTRGRYASCGGKKKNEACIDMPDFTGGKCVHESEPETCTVVLDTIYG